MGAGELADDVVGCAGCPEDGPPAPVEGAVDGAVDIAEVDEGMPLLLVDVVLSVEVEVFAMPELVVVFVSIDSSKVPAWEGTDSRAYPKSLGSFPLAVGGGIGIAGWLDPFRLILLPPPPIPVAALLDRLVLPLGVARRNICGMRARDKELADAVPFSECSCWKESNSTRRWFRLRRNSVGLLQLRSRTVGRERPKRR